MIALSTAIAYCAILSIISSDVVDLHICICVRVSSYQLLIIPVCCAAATEPRSPPRSGRADPVYRSCWPVSSVYYRMTKSHVIDLLFWKRSRELVSFTSDFVEWRSTVLWVLERRRARKDRLETRGESGSESPSDTTGEDLVLVRWVVLLCFSPHRDTAVNCLIRWPHPVQVLITTTTDTRHHRPFAARLTTPAVRFVAVVYTVATTLLCACSLSLAMTSGWHSQFYTML